MKSDVKLIVRITLFFWVIAKAISWKLWLADREFPLVPVISFPPAVHEALFLLFVLLVILVFIKPLQKHFILFLLLTEIAAMLGDQVRWQPWIYQFLFILLSVLINQKNKKRVMNCIILILSSTYFFSGIQKLNRSFLYNVWTKLILIRFFHLPALICSNMWLHYAGLFIPAFEMVCGCALLLKKQSLFYALLPLAMHLFVIFFLSPLGIKYNMIVIPWNIIMGIFIYLIFIKNKLSFSFPDLFFRANMLISFAWIFLPVLGMFGYWDKFFSSSVYSGNSIYLKVYVNKSASHYKELSPYLSLSKKGFQNRYNVINFNYWSLSELNVPVPPQQRILKQIEDSFARKYPDLEPVFVYY